MDRMRNPQSNSYTSKIIQSEEKIKEKIKEECSEVLNYKNRENLIWEVADLFYFTFILMVKKGIDIKDVKNELWRRRK